MYTERFDTDWQELAFEEAIHRMYTLGVAAELDARLPEERDRIEATAETAYTRKVLELAYEEGRQVIRDVSAGRAEADSVEEVLAEGPSVLESDEASEERSDAESAGVGGGSFADPPEGAPDAVKLPSLLDGETDELERVRPPSFLTRDDE